jgi:pyruvyltransferase
LAVELYHYVPRLPVLNAPLIRRCVPRRPVINFGDAVGPVVVAALLAQEGLPSAAQSRAVGRLFSVGSVMHFVRSGDHVWGSGINGKVSHSLRFAPGEATINSVRGPSTRARLMKSGFDVPEVYGDPALLLPILLEDYRAVRGSEKRRKLTIIPNINEVWRYRFHPAFVSPMQDPLTIAQIIAESDFVTGSSLHAMVFADALGVPSRPMMSAVEHPFKYEDYYGGSGRPDVQPAEDVRGALRAGPVGLPDFDPTPLLDAFPRALFHR